MHSIREAQTSGLATTEKSMVWRSRIIEGDRWGSSGYYSRDVLERDGPSTWPAGTQVYLDHPGAADEGRPERSVRDLAGKIVSTPAYESDGLYAEIELYPHVAPVIESMAADIGLSIRAGAEVEAGEAGGREGWIITALSEGQSVDLVTKPGAGGKLVSLMESARQEAHAAEALPGGGTVDDLRDALNTAIRAVHDDSYVETFTDTTVVYRVYDETTNGLFQQTYTAEPVTLTGSPVRVRQRTTYEPVSTAPAEQTTATTESRKGNLMAHVNIEESELKQLRDDAGRVTELETQLTEAKSATVNAAEALRAANEAADIASAESIISGADVEFTSLERKGLLVGKPITEAGRLDADKFREQVTEAAAEKAAASGAGRPFGVGGSTTTATEGMSWDAYDKALAEIKEA